MTHPTPQPYGNLPPGYAHPPAPRKSHVGKILAGIALVVALCVGGTVVVAAVASSDPAADTAGEQLVASDDATSSPAGKATSKPTSKATSKPAGLPSTFKNDGEYEAGRHIRAGKYETEGAAPGLFELCAWTISTSAGDPVDGGASEGRQSATIRDGYVIETTGCKPWSLVK